LIELIIFFIPYIGLSTYTKPIVYFVSIGVFYLLLKLLINVLQFSFESSNKNKIVDTILGSLFGIINGVIGLAIILSILFYSFRVPENTIDRLNSSAIFKYIYIVKTTLVDYGE
jgi:membrane-associated HD superfamily phosphohydrolase